MHISRESRTRRIPTVALHIPRFSTFIHRDRMHACMRRANRLIRNSVLLHARVSGKWYRMIHTCVRVRVYDARHEKRLQKDRDGIDLPPFTGTHGISMNASRYGIASPADMGVDETSFVQTHNVAHNVGGNAWKDCFYGL